MLVHCGFNPGQNCQTYMEWRILLKNATHTVTQAYVRSGFQSTNENLKNKLEIKMNFDLDH